MQPFQGGCATSRHRGHPRAGAPKAHLGDGSLRVQECKEPRVDGLWLLKLQPVTSAGDILEGAEVGEEGLHVLVPHDALLLLELGRVVPRHGTVGTV